jgi:hypothetical protein
VAGTVVVMPLLAKGLFVLVKSRTGRKILFTTTLAMIELAQSEQARKLYGKARTTFNDGARRAAHAIRSVG